MIKANLLRHLSEYTHLEVCSILAIAVVHRLIVAGGVGLYRLSRSAGPFGNFDNQSP
jgi:hypothetical protein